MTAEEANLVSILDCEFEALPEGWGAKPCPFCGEKKDIMAFKYRTAAGDRYGIICMGCLANVNSGYWQNPGQALFQGWNERANSETAEVMKMLE